MVVSVSFNVYEVMNVFELIVLCIFGVFIFYKREETFSRVMRLTTSSTLFIINVLELPMEVQMDKSYGMTILVIILFFINALIVTYSLGKDN